MELSDLIKQQQKVLKQLDDLAIDRYTSKIEWRQLKHPRLSNYYLSENADLIKVLASGKITEIKTRWTYKKGSDGQPIRNGIAQDQFYENRERWLITPRTRLMMWVYGDWNFEDIKAKNKALFFFNI